MSIAEIGLVIMILGWIIWFLIAPRNKCYLCGKDAKITCIYCGRCLCEACSSDEPEGETCLICAHEEEE